MKEDQIDALTQDYAAAIPQSVSFTTSAGVTKMFQADVENSQQKLLIATTGYNLAGATPDGFYWVAADNTQAPFTLADLNGLYAAMLAQGNAAFQKLQTLKAAVRGATSIPAVQAVTRGEAKANDASSRKPPISGSLCNDGRRACDIKVLLRTELLHEGPV